jgi:Ca2+-binding EF-hand superfamily protein
MITRAFQVLDGDNKGYLTKDELVRYMTSEGISYILRKIYSIILS